MPRDVSPDAYATARVYRERMRGNLENMALELGFDEAVKQAHETIRDVARKFRGEGRSTGSYIG